MDIGQTERFIMLLNIETSYFLTLYAMIISDVHFFSHTFRLDNRTCLDCRRNDLFGHLDLKRFFDSCLTVDQSVFQSTSCSMVLLMKLIVNNGHVIINIHDLMVIGLIIMVLMKLIAIDSRNVILIIMNVYRRQLSISYVYR
jgi:hypothetical protein